MDLWDETERNLVELNAELSRSGDPARVRYMVIQPDPDLGGRVDGDDGLGTAVAGSRT